MKPIDELISLIPFPHLLIYWVTYRMLIRKLLLVQKYYGLNQSLQNVCRCYWLLCLLFRYFLTTELGKVIKLSILNTTLYDIETVYTLMFYVQVLFISNLFQFVPNIMHDINLGVIKSHSASHLSVGKGFKALQIRTDKSITATMN